MLGTRFIPTWEELKQAKKIKMFRKFNNEDSETVSTVLLRRIFFYAMKNGERVTFPEGWNRSEYISKKQYELWYDTYANKTHLFEFLNETRSFSDKRVLNSKAWKFILEGEEED